MTSLLAWAWLLTLPGLLLTATGVPGGRRRVGWASVPGPFVLFALATAALATGAPPDGVVYPDWLPFLPDSAFRLRVDALASVMLALLGLVAGCVYVYSLGYMAEDAGRRRFFLYLDFFVAAMALLVLAGNLAVLLVGWTGVGIASFLLISFWHDRPGALGAGMRALAANAIGDGALLAAVVIQRPGCGDLLTLARGPCSGDSQTAAELVAALVFVAAAAKSAQGPLYFWLPTAMAGPTPISALIHAATMVAAGVYLLVRTHAVFEAAPIVASWVAAVGVATAISASFASLRQTNFKRAIAYSTVAQLGYMFAAAGVGAPFAALFHLLTHGAFKAVLFLSAGVVIHGAGGEERLGRLTGAGKRNKSARWAFLIGSLALIGTPFTAGGLSKDLVLERVVEYQPLLGWLLTVSTGLTGLYVGRLFFRVYVGHPEIERTELHEHRDSANRFMMMGLIPLVALSAVGGLVAWPQPWLQGALSEVVGEGPPLHAFSLPGSIAFGLGLAGFLASALLVRRTRKAETPSEPGDWATSIGRLGYRLAGMVANAHSGLLPRYAFASVASLAIVIGIRLVVR